MKIGWPGTGPRTLADDAGESERSPIRDRWVDRPDIDGGDLESRAGALFRGARRPEPLDQARLAAPLAEAGVRWRHERYRPHRRRWPWQLAVGALLMFSGAALTVAATRVFHWSFVVGPQATKSPAETDQSRAHRGHPSRPALPPEGDSSGVVVPEAAPEATAPHDPGLAPPPIMAAPRAPTLRALPRPPAFSISPPTSPSTSSPPPAPLESRGLAPPAAELPPARETALAAESRLLGQALRRLRRENDAPGALAILDEHDRRFPGGTLASEARLARIEALIATGRFGESLSLLNGLDWSPRGPGRGPLVARAELRAATGNLAEAERDFSAVLGGDRARDGLTERALWGRAMCRTARGDSTGARADLADYLVLFPAGRFAERARAALAR